MKKEKNRHKKVNILFFSILVICILFISIGYSAFNTRILMTNMIADVRIVEDIRISSISAEGISGGSSTYEDYNVSSVSMGVSLPNSTSKVRYKLGITNIGNATMGIQKIEGLPSNLVYSFEDYNEGEALCNNDKCNNNMQKDIYLVIEYKSGGYNSGVTTYNLDLDVIFKRAYSVTYKSIIGNYQSTTLVDAPFIVNFGSNAPEKVVATMGGEYADFTYENGVFTYDEVTGDVVIKQVLCFPADANTVTTGNIPQIGMYRPGDEYICNVDGVNKYHFFVLSNTNGKVNMILDRDLTSSGGFPTSSDGNMWYWSPSNNSTGPTTAISTLNGATASWVIIPNVDETYTDAGGHYTMTFTGKARLPKVSEVSVAGCDMVSKTYLSCPLYLMNYLDNGYAYPGRTHVTGLTGYWLLDTPTGNTTNAYALSRNGYGITTGVTTVRAIRPVISIPEDQIHSEEEAKMCIPVSSSKAGNVPNGNYLPGDEYTCQVGDNASFNFYILSVNGDNVNMIMNRNITSTGKVATDTDTGLVAWYSTATRNNTYGPLAAMDALYSATSSWNKLPNITVNYTDPSSGASYGYTGIYTTGSSTVITAKAGTTTATYNNLKARLPEYDEIDNLCPDSMCEYFLVNGTSYYEDELDVVLNIAGYWTATTKPSGAANAYYVDEGAEIITKAVNNHITAGIRPVITVKKSDLG